MPVAIPSRRSLSAVLAGNLTSFFVWKDVWRQCLNCIWYTSRCLFQPLDFAALKSAAVFFFQWCAFCEVMIPRKRSWSVSLRSLEASRRPIDVERCHAGVNPWTIRSWLHWNDINIQLFLWKWGSPILMPGISRIAFVINSTVPDFHGKLWECFGKLGIFGQVRMVYDQKGKPRGCGKGWLMLWRKSPVS